MREGGSKQSARVRSGVLNKVFETTQWTSYMRLPRSLEQKFPQLALAQKDDENGSLARLEAITFAIGDRTLEHVIDIGGHSGYFCLSLIDAGIIKTATVYDLATEALSVGRMMAEHMGIANRIEFVERSVDLDFLRELPRVDAIFCLNLLHHAGQQFDQARVRRDGWASYATEWLTEMRRKSRLSILSMAFRRNLPPYWGTPYETRPASVAQLALQAGWTILYEANVSNIQTLGVPQANGRYSKGGATLQRPLSWSPIFRDLKWAAKIMGLKGPWRALTRVLIPENSKTEEYHLYVLEEPCQRRK
jgi:hypothetical protein